MKKRLAGALILGLLLGGSFTLSSAAQPLSNQVLALLTRVNTWTATNTFNDLRLPVNVPSDTVRRFYTDTPGNLYFNGLLVATAGAGIGPHNILSATHLDTVAAGAVRGDLIIANSTPKWVRLPIGPAANFLRSNGTDPFWSNNGGNLINLTAANLTGSLPAIPGANLTTLNATSLTTGTVPLARLSGITFTQWGSSGCANNDLPRYNGAAWVCVAYPSTVGTVTSVALTTPAIFSVAGSPVTAAGTLAVTLATETANTVWAGPAGGGAVVPTFRALVNADLPLTGIVAGTYAKLTVNTAGVATAGNATINLGTDVSSTLLAGNGGTGVAVSADDTLLVGSGAAWVAQTLPNCPSPGALGYTQATNLFNCVTTGGPTHALLSATHTDTLAAAVVRGDLVRGNSSPAWSRLAVGGSGSVLWSDGTDPQWVTTPRLAAQLFAALGTPANGTIAWCSNCDPASTPCTTGGASTGSFAFRQNAAWKCF